MREIKYIVIHCTATSQDTTIESIKRYWKEVLKWKNVGYHYIVEANGTINRLSDDETITNGVKGYNSKSIHISYIGGVNDKNKPVDNRTQHQKYSLYKLVNEYKKRYPNAEVKGHRDFKGVVKACPSFDVKTEL